MQATEEIVSSALLFSISLPALPYSLLPRGRVILGSQISRAERESWKSESGNGESLCKRVSENLFSIATSAAKVQAYEVRLKVKAES